MSNFDRMFDILLQEEGGWVDDKNDPGGETKYGITWMTLKSAIAKGLVPAVTTIKTLAPEQAKAIYKTFYWDAVKGDQLPWPMCCFVFDSAVNQGEQPAIKMLQRALDRPQDGIMGAATMAAAAKAGRYHAARFMAFRAMRYNSTRNFDRFGEGWLIRIFELAMRTGEQ